MDNIIHIPIRAFVTKKNYNVAKFHTTCNPIDLKKFARPVRMYRAAEPVGDGQQPQLEPKKKPQPAFSRFTKDAKTVPWHIEDNEGNNCYDGTLEGGQTSNYVLFIYENGEFKVIPSGDWYNFRPKRNYQTLSIEEAEAMMNSRQRAVQRVAENMNRSTNKQSGESANNANAGSSACLDDDRDKEDEEFAVNGDAEEDKFATVANDEEQKSRFRKGRTKKKDNADAEEDEDEEEERADGEEEPDWKGMFDDDEDETQMVVDVDEEEPSGMRDQDAEGDNDEKLTDSGKELRNLLKNHRKDDDLSETSDAFGSDSDEDEDDEFNLEERLPPILFPKLQLNVAASVDSSADVKIEETPIIKELSAEEKPRTPPSQTHIPPLTPQPEKEKKMVASTRKVKGNVKGKIKGGAKPEAGGTPGVGGGGTGKKPHSKASAKRGNTATSSTLPSTSVQQNTAKKVKTEIGPVKVETTPSKPVTPTSITGTSTKPVTEDDVRRLLLHGKRLRTIDLINHFRANLADQLKKEKFSDIIKKLCTIVDDGGIKFLQLKPEYR